MDLGDIRAGDTIDYKWTSRDAGVPTTLAGVPAVSVYKSNSTTESTAGVTLTTDFDAKTGLNHVRITTSSDATFYAVANEFDIVITTGTVAGNSVVGEVVGHFSIENRSSLRPTVAGRTLDVAATGEAGLDFDNVKAATGATTLTNIRIPNVTLADTVTNYTGNTPQTGDSFARIGAPAGVSVSADIAAITAAVGANDLTTKVADSGAIIASAGTVISGTFASTSSDDNTYWITAPVTPAISGFGLNQSLVFNLPLGRIPISLLLRGYWNGTGRVADVYALNSRTGVYDKLTNTGTNLASRTTELLYPVLLPRDYADSSGGANNVVTIQVRSTSTTTADRLRLDQVLVTHVSEAIATTLVAPTAGDIWSYVTRTLTIPGVDPVPPLTPTDIRDAVGLASANLDTQLNTIGGGIVSIYAVVDTEVAAIKVKTDNLPASPAAVGSQMNLADAAITDAKFSYAEPTGPATTGIVSKIAQMWNGLFNKTVKDKVAGEIKTHDAAGAVVTTQTYTSTGTADQVNKAT